MKFHVDDEIELRLLELQDASILFELTDQNRFHLRQWLPWLDRNTTVEHTRDYIRAVHEQMQCGKGFSCGVFFRDSLVGICGYHDINQLDQSVVIGYWLSESSQGKGIITRCALFFLNYAFEELDLKTVLIPVAEGNKKSREVCERLGLVNEGIERKAECLYGNYVDHIHYALSREAWMAKQKTP